MSHQLSGTSGLAYMVLPGSCHILEITLCRADRDETVAVFSSLMQRIGCLA